jgi:hypothetical protein
MKLGALSKGTVKLSSGGRRVWLLGISTLGGILLGAFLASRCSRDALDALQAYVTAYCGLPDNSRACGGLGTALAFCRVPLLMLAVSFCGLGIVAVPLLAAWEGMSLSYAAVSFSAAMGKPGVLLALAAFGVRGAVLLPCMLFTGGTAWRLAYERKGLAALSGRDLRGILICFAALTLGVILECSLAPRLMTLALAG